MQTFKTRLPRLAITLGDVAGIGPELIVRAWACAEVHRICRPFVIGNAEIVRRAVALVGTGCKVVAIDAPEQASPTPSVIPCVDPLDADELSRVEPGKVDRRAGAAAFSCLALAAEFAQTDRADGIVTAPLCKEALHLAGHPYPGHTEALANLCGKTDSAMMLYMPPGAGIAGPNGLGVVHVTLHMAVADVPGRITSQAVTRNIHWLNEMMTRLSRRDEADDVSPPRLAVAALNPHAGEGGDFGCEEIEVIAPAVRAARSEGVDVVGPLPADSLFWKAKDGAFDGVVAMYHDQGHIALKLLGFHRAVNITLGLPVVRTSPTYGTAFDIAWKGVAESEGMVEAIRVAAMLAIRRPHCANEVKEEATSPVS